MPHQTRLSQHKHSPKRHRQVNPSRTLLEPLLSQRRRQREPSLHRDLPQATRLRPNLRRVVPSPLRAPPNQLKVLPSLLKVLPSLHKVLPSLLRVLLNQPRVLPSLLRVLLSLLKVLPSQDRLEPSLPQSQHREPLPSLPRVQQLSRASLEPSLRRQTLKASLALLANNNKLESAIWR